MRTLVKVFGIDPEHIKLESNKLIWFSVVISLSIILGGYGFYYAMFETTGSIVIGVVIGLFFGLLILNLYRLFFSIISTRYRPKSNFVQIAISIIKRAYILIILAAFVSKSLETQILSRSLNKHLSNWKYELVENYKNTLDANIDSERQEVLADFRRKLSDDQLFDRDSEVNRKEYEAERDALLQDIEASIEIRIHSIENEIRRSNFFITRIRFLAEGMPASWFITALMVVLFVYPVYIFLFDPLFIEYARSSEAHNRDKVISEHTSFVVEYNKLFDKFGEKTILWEELYVDPPFNSLKKPREYEVLNKGSLVKWIEKFG